MTNLKKLGWNDFFEKHFQQYKEQGFSAGRILVENKNNYVIYTDFGEVQGEVTGKFIFHSASPSQFPKTGDWVVISLFDNNTMAIIHELLPRKTKISRKSPDKRTDEQIIASNVDVVFIMQSLDNNFNINRLARYLVTVNESGAKPVILLSKADLCNDAEIKLNEVKQIAPDTEAVVISSFNNLGIAEVLIHIKESETVALIGSSGVGKSTLINLLAGEELLRTSEVRTVDAKGKHTTTKREMIFLPSGGILIDTPGMRELALWNAGQGLTSTFSEFDEFARQCHFSDCTHTHEIKCAVLDALQHGVVSKEKYDNYLKLRKEIKYLESKQDVFAQLEEKRKWKNIHKEIKRLNRYK